MARPGSSNPIDCNSSSASSSLSSANSASVFASRKIASAGATRADSCARSSVSLSSAASTLKTYRKGFAVNSCSSAMTAKSTLLLDSGLPELRTASASLAASTTLWRSLFTRASFSRRGNAFSIVCKSASANSVLMISMSLAGSTRPSTWMTSPSLNTRMTWQIASVSRILAKNLLPRPAPSDAPFTIPAISTKETTAGRRVCDPTISANAAKRVSGTPTTPTLGSMVAKG